MKFKFLLIFLFSLFFARNVFCEIIVLKNWEMHKGDLKPEEFDKASWQPTEKTYFEHISKTNITLCFRTRLPDIKAKDLTLNTFHFDQYVEIFLETNFIYSFGSKEKNLSAFGRHFVDLPEDVSHKYLYIKVFSSFQNIGFSYNVYLGEKSDIFRLTLSKDIDKVVTSVIFILIGVAAIFLAFSTETQFFSFLSCGIFSILLGITTFCRTDLRYFLFTNNAILWGYLELLSLYLLLSPIAYYVYLLNEKEKNNPFTRVIFWAVIVDSVFAISIFLFSLVDSNILLKILDAFTMLLMGNLILGVIDTLYLMILKKNKEAIEIFSGMLILMLFSIKDSLEDLNILPRMGFSAYWGLLIFILLLLDILRRRIYNIHRDLKVYTRQLELDKIYIKKSNEELTYLSKELEATQKEVIFKLCEIAEARSHETGNHIIRVSQYSRMIAENLGLSEKDIRLISLASPMHDIGKLAIPDNILNKPSKLTEEEFEIIKTHTTIGYEMLMKSSHELFTSAALIALQHHEHYDGTGYPKGLKGNEIHIYGKIVAIADVFDSLSCDRVYKKAWPVEQVLEYIENEKGKHFDPELVDVLFKYIDLFLRIRDRYNDKFEFSEALSTL